MISDEVKVTYKDLNVQLEELRRRLKGPKGLKRETRLIQKKCVEAAAAILKSAVYRNMSLTDHTLADLARMNHPYARKHGSIQVHQNRPYVVHKRSGRMREALFIRTEHRPGGHGGGVRYHSTVGIDYARQRYFKYVIQGTKKMLPRDTLYHVSQIPKVRENMIGEVKKILASELKATVNSGLGG